MLDLPLSVVNKGKLLMWTIAAEKCEIVQYVLNKISIVCHAPSVHCY